MTGECVIHQRCKLKGLLALFMLLAFTFFYARLGSLVYFILLFFSVVWLLLELKWDASGKRLKKAFFIGLFLMIFDFAVENTGGFLGLWKTYGSIFPVYFVPLEIIFICTLGGMAWALYLPSKFNLGYSLFDVLFFSFFGALGEALLIRNGLMLYTGSWNSVYAFFGYLVMWLVLHFMRYGVWRDEG